MTHKTERGEDKPFGGISLAYREAHGLTPQKIAETMCAFYEEVAAMCARVETQLAESGIRLKCHAGCCACCQDGLTMTQAEQAVIRKLYPEIGLEGPHGAGQCAFLDDAGKCRIYEARPLKCRTFGLPLVWQGEAGDTRDICELEADSVDVQALPSHALCRPELADTKLGIMEIATFGTLKRVSMRSFFEHKKVSG